ncbi:FMN reductase [Amycolatopsis sp. NBRC 101858]|uniref:NAD(P)H-dependent oxidoreductase n=1 Tax=Amycolatopsis sp. NBRC 101858 TaxID=3032200 RepID=UPI0024A3870E|nr:NAD(P)H-dependent oxidoreductase [Amycolatopsis sp. NBRC 101858]GLY35194.1 FMN reductase [Amycolatopsis sp. NBRC 101858]
MIKIGIVLGRRGDRVARWVHERAVDRADAEFELMDHPLPDPAAPPADHHEDASVQEWAEAVGACDGFVFVTPEYDHSLENVIGHAHAEWADKAAGFVAGARAVEQLRLVCGAVRLADVSAQVTLPPAAEFEPDEDQLDALDAVLDQVVAWSTALAPVRQGDAEAEIKAKLGLIIEGLRAKDLEVLKGVYAPDVVSFDVEPPLQHVGLDAKLANWAKVFTFFEKVDYELRDLTLTVSADLAVGHGFGRVSGTLRDGTAVDGMWVRATFVLRKREHGWQIVHDQASVPFDMATGRGVTDLRP